MSLFSFGPYYRLSGPAERVGTKGIRIASFNTGNTRTPGGRERTTALQTALDQMDADILCFQELDRRSSYSLPRYPYRAISPDKPDKSTQAIFSTYPIVGSGNIDFNESANNAMYADIVVEGDTIRVYNVHLQSYRIRSPRLKRFIFRDNGMTFLKRIQAVANLHVEQAQLVKEHQESSPYRSVICGDFNATPFSRTHRILSKGLNDSFGEAGSGYAGTYSRRGIPFRIDFILADLRMEVLRHQTHDIRLSDHLPVSATLRLHSQ
nr:endonuclease/exonuclease/phosphatase family protein [Robiginitalea sp. SC105]